MGPLCLSIALSAVALNSAHVGVLLWGGGCDGRGLGLSGHFFLKNNNKIKDFLQFLIANGKFSFKGRMVLALMNARNFKATIVTGLMVHKQNFDNFELCSEEDLLCKCLRT